MGLDVILECEKRCPVGQNPKTVHSSYRRSLKVEERDAKEKPTSRSSLLESLDDDFGELSLSNCPIPSRKSMPCRPVGMKVEGEVSKRGSVYQSSKEVRKMRRSKEARRTTESVPSDETFLSFEIVNSVSRDQQDEANPSTQQKRTPLHSLNADLSSTSLDSTQTVLTKDNSQKVLTKSADFLDLSFRLLPEQHLSQNSLVSDSFLDKEDSSDSFLEINLVPNEKACRHAKTIYDQVERCPVKELKFNCSESLGPENDGNVLSERDAVHILPKSFSAKVDAHHSPCQSDSDRSKDSPKVRFSPLRKMFDPITKSKSQRNPSISVTEVSSLTPTDSSCMKRNRASRKSLLSDFSKTAQKTQNTEYNGQLIVGEQGPRAASSPAHLHGILKPDNKDGIPSFEFSLKDPEDVLSAKTWRTGNAFNWVYTFHGSKKKNSIGAWGTKERNRQSSLMVGQMQVSCYLCSEVSTNESLDNSVVTEFILYDISHARRSFAYEERYPCSLEVNQPPSGTIAESLANGMVVESNDSLNPGKCKNPSRIVPSDRDAGSSVSDPWEPTDLLPHLEAAATVIQIPFGKKGTLKDRLRDDHCAKEYSDSSGTSVTDHGRDATSNSLYPDPVNVKVVTPSGRHGLPCTEEGGPSPLLHRWRSGGQCDCGGWDMACPITVLDNSSTENAEDYPFRKSQLPLQLFVQGTKDEIPALTITAGEEGHYLVDFHAQFSTLQVFSICVAVLHSLEAFGTVGQENSKQRLHSNSLKLLLEEEVRNLMKAVAEEEKRKVKKKVEQMSGPYLVDPPFSPMGRV